MKRLPGAFSFLSGLRFRKDISLSPSVLSVCMCSPAEAEGQQICSCVCVYVCERGGSSPGERTCFGVLRTGCLETWVRVTVNIWWPRLLSIVADLYTVIVCGENLLKLQSDEIWHHPLNSDWAVEYGSWVSWVAINLRIRHWSALSVAEAPIWRAVSFQSTTYCV